MPLSSLSMFHLIILTFIMFESLDMDWTIITNQLYNNTFHVYSTAVSISENPRWIDMLMDTFCLSLPLAKLKWANN